MTGLTNRFLLLVEDDALVRDTVVMMLEEDGFKVAEAANAEEALALIESGLEPRVMVTDVDLGAGQSGTELADMAHRIRPDLRIIFITGRTASLAGRRRHEWEAVLPKPFESRALSRLIRQMSAEG